MQAAASVRRGIQCITPAHFRFDELEQLLSELESELAAQQSQAADQEELLEGNEQLDVPSEIQPSAAEIQPSVAEVQSFADHRVLLQLTQTPAAQLQELLQLLEHVEGSSGMASRAAIEALAVLPCEQSNGIAPLLIDKIEHHQNSVKWAAISLLGKITSKKSGLVRDCSIKEIAQKMVNRLQEPEWWVRSAAARVLEKLPIDAVVLVAPPLSTIANEQCWWVRCSLAKTIVRCAEHLMNSS